MKYVLVIGDGMADTYLSQLAGQTPLEALALPAFDRCAGCQCGRALTVPHGLPAGSDTAILSIFGYSSKTYYTGRSVLEAAGMGVKVPQGCVSFRVNLCAVTPDDTGALVIHSHNGGNIHGQEATALMNDLIADPGFAAMMREAGLEITVTDTFRHVGVMKTTATDLAAVRLTEPHNVLEQAIEPHLPHMLRDTDDAAADKMCRDIRALMLRSYELLKDHPVNRQRVAQGKLPAECTWSAFGIGKGHLPVMFAALANEGHVRVGMEDNVVYGRNPDGTKIMATNLMLVQRAANAIKAFGNEVATPAEAREMLGLKPLDHEAVCAALDAVKVEDLEAAKKAVKDEFGGPYWDAGAMGGKK